MEDDVLFTGRWRALFASYAHDDADILSYSCDYHPSHSAHWGAGNNCRLPGGRPCVDPALPRNLTKIRWPVMRLSRRLADLVAEKLQAGARGHHEALTGAVCDEDPGCRSGILDDSHRGFVELGHWGRYSGPLSLEQLVNGSVEPGKLYHPVRCRGEPSLPAIAMSYSVSPREGRWRTKDDELNQAVVSAHGVASGSRGYC
ncbi:hypothetical protein DFJ74DRAFT_655587 [Hyaloraphidium curvatum]|nr:hypothetical protein DFJ74DRAFT_655587 [Hyaloraphidium curvatum]